MYHGWWQVLICGAICAYSSGILFYGFTAFFNPLIQDFGWSRASTSLGYGLYRLEGGLVAPLFGYFIDRFGSRKMMLAGVIALGLGFIFLSFIQTLWGFYIVFLFIAFGNSLGFSHVGYYVAANWFFRKRGVALGLFSASIGLGGLLVPVLALIITAWGWRTSAWVAGVGMWVVGIPLALLVRHRPETYGLLPDGEPPRGGHSASLTNLDRGVRSLGEKREFTLRGALRTRPFWLFSLALIIPMTTSSALYVHQMPFLLEVGIPVGTAALVVTGTVTMSVLWRLAFGWMSDRLSKRLIMSAALVCQSLGLLFFARIEQSWEVIPFIILFGAGYGGMLPLRGAIQAEYFGTVAFGAIQGTLYGIWTAGTILGPVIAGRFFDLTGDYRMVFTIFGLLILICIPIMLASKPPEPTGVDHLD